MARFRPQRLGDQLQVELAALIDRRIRDPRVGFVTVTEVRVSPDLRYARVYVSVYGDEEQKRESLAALRRASGFLRGQIGGSLRLRRVPELSFFIDDTLDRSDRIDELLEKAGGQGEGASEAEASAGEGSQGSERTEDPVSGSDPPADAGSDAGSEDEP